MAKPAPILRRAAGVMLPVASLPGPDGIGDFGPAAEKFLAWLHLAGQRYWQILPLTIPDQTGSPYASRSSRALNWLLISPEALQHRGWLPAEWPIYPASQPIKYQRVAMTKWRMIKTAYRGFLDQATTAERAEFTTFRHGQWDWLDDFVLFQALKDRFRQQPWWRWPTVWQRPASARTRVDRYLTHQMEVHAFAQWLADRQWQHLRRVAKRYHLAIIGDLPFYVQHDSVDVWAHRQLFDLDRRGQPRVVAGVPPDSFSRAGQHWGNPVYRWSAHRREHWRWWTDRLVKKWRHFDLVRFDHFLGLAETYHIPARAGDARHGRWVPTPGRDILDRVARRLGRLPLVAEDLGPSRRGAEALRRHFQLPAIRLLIFGWSGLPHNIHAPAEVMTNSIYLTTNHDTNTMVGWWRDQSRRYERQNFRNFPSPPAPVHRRAIDIVYHSRARVAMVTPQDLLGLGSAARLNTPGHQRGNWRWRVPITALTPALAKQLRRLARDTQRL